MRESVRQLAVAALWIVLSCVVILIGGLPIAVVIQINMRLEPAVPWFVVPAGAVALAVLKWTERFVERLPIARQVNPIKMTVLSAILAVVLAAVALVLTPHGTLRQGALVGDADPAPLGFRIAHTLAWVACVGAVEEGAVRNMVQLKLQRRLKPILAEAIAGMIFVLIHAPRLRSADEIALVLLVAFVSGRLAAVTQSARYSTIVHSLSNVGISAAIMLVR